MEWRVAKSLLHLRDQVNAKFPHRNRENDGTIGDEAHASRTSDHNAWIVDPAGGPNVVSAMDITHDPAHGLDSYKMADELKVSGDKRIKYVISNRRIWSPSVSTSWRPYHGENPHDHHVHISVNSDKAHYDDTHDWSIPMLGGVTPDPTPVPPDGSKELHEHITATEFGGPKDFNRSFYDGHVISNSELGVALPFKFKGVRPKVRVMGPHGTAVGAIVDLGPWDENDPYWLKKGGRPRAESGTDERGRHTNLAGIDLTPALARIVGINGKGIVNWEFVDAVHEPAHVPSPAVVTPVGSPVPTAHRAPAALVKEGGQRTLPVLPGSKTIADKLRGLFGRKS